MALNKLSRGRIGAGRVDADIAATAGSIGAAELASASATSVKRLDTITTPASTVAISGPGTYLLANSTGAGGLVYTLAAPTAGHEMKLYLNTLSTSTGTDIVKVKPASTAITFDGTNKVLTFNAVGENVTLVAQTATRWMVTSNVGAVGLAATT